MKRNYTKRAYSLVEMIVAISIFSVISLGVYNGILQINKHIGKIKNFVSSRQELANFCQSVYSFANKSYGAYFYNEADQSEMDYLNDFSSITEGDTILDSLFFMKDSTGDISNTGCLSYNPTEHTISWIRLPGDTPQIVLEGVYRKDYINDTSPGNDPIFKFPHKSTLFVTQSRPRFIIIEFKKLINEATSVNPIPEMLRIKVTAQLNTTN